MQKFGMNELLFDLLVCKSSTIKPRNGISDLTVITKCLWQVESELALLLDTISHCTLNSLPNIIHNNVKKLHKHHPPIDKSEKELTSNYNLSINAEITSNASFPANKLNHY